MVSLPKQAQGYHITNVTIQGHLADLPQRKVLVWPDFGHIKDIPAIVLGLGGIHYLDKNIPRGVVFSLDSLEHISNHVIGILAGNFGCLCLSEILDSLLGLHLDLDIFE